MYMMLTLRQSDWPTGLEFITNGDPLGFKTLSDVNNVFKLQILLVLGHHMPAKHNFAQLLTRFVFECNRFVERINYYIQ